MPDDKLPQDVVDVALELATFLDSHSYDYAFGGAIALGYWAAPRGTVDVDLTVFLAPDEPSDCISLLQDVNCEFSSTDVMMSLREHGFCRVLYRGFQLDVFLPTIPFYAEARSKRRRVTLAGKPIMIWDSETLCVFKMMFFRLKDFADVEQMLRVQGADLDRQWVLNHLQRIYGQRDPRVTRWTELVAQVDE